MEKISRIVSGSQRVASVDLKNSPAVRPGTPSYGRPIGDSHGEEHDPRTTAQRAVEIHNLREDKKAQDARDAQMVRQMASQFFISHVPAQGPGKESEVSAEPVEVGAQGPQEGEVSEGEAPHGYTPRGSYVDVRA